MNKNLTSNKPIIILVEPQLAENVGMAARAMMNCGLEQLYLINPREDHLSDKAISASSNAEEILYRAKVFSSLDEALHDIDFLLATTARHRDQTKTVYTADKAANVVAQKIFDGVRCGFLFGPERTGLRNEDVCLADAIINIPLNPKHCSLNLSQAVLLVGYEFYKTQIDAPQEQFVVNHSRLAGKDHVLKFCEFLESNLDDCGNFKVGEKREKMIINLRNIFTRNQMTEQELNTLYGAIRHLLKK